MRAQFLCIVTTLFAALLPVTTSPVKFDDGHRLPREQGRSLQQREEEARIFHAHALIKRRKRKLLQCLLNLRRNNPKALQGDPRFLLLNYVNLEYTQHGGDGGGHSGGGGSNCLSQFTGGMFGGNGDNNEDGGGGDGDGGPDLGGIGEGISNLGSLVGQVGQAPASLVSTVSEGVKPVFENPERYFNRYIIRPLYRSIRPFYRLF